MPVLDRASAGFLKRHPWQLACALIGICAGVAVMVAVDLANASAERAFALSLDTVNGRATHQVVGGPDGVDEALYVELRVQHGVAGIAPIVTGDVEADDHALTLLGVDPFAEGEVRRYAAPGRGGGDVPVRALLTTPGAVLLSRSRAAQLGVGVGERFELVANGRTRTAELVGLLDGGRPDAALDDLVVADIALAQAWLASRGRLSRIDAVIPRGGEESFRERLPAGVQLLPTARRSRAVMAMSDAFTTNLTAMSLLALLVGVFLIYNSVSFAVLTRRGLLGILRALGVTRQQAFRLILREAAVLGAVGALLGVAAGVGLAGRLLELVSQSINDLYFRVTVTELHLDPWSIGKGLLAGFGVTLLAALVPAREAAGCPPRLALSRSTLESRARSLTPRLGLAGAGMVAAAIGVLAISGQSLAAGLAALFLIVVGAALWIPAAVRLAARTLAPLARRVGGPGARLAIAGVAASLSRTGVAIVALAVAVSATIGVSVMVDSFRGSVTAWLEQSLQADFYVAVDGGGELDPALAADLAAAAGVAATSSSRRVWLESDDGLTRLIALDMAPGSRAGIELVDAQAADVWPAFDTRGAVLVSETLAYRRNLERGDALYLPTARGPRAFPVAAVYRSYDANAGAAIMSREIYDTFWSDDAVDSLGIYLAADADAEQVAARLEEIAAGRQSIAVRSNRELYAASLEIFDRTFVITDVLYWLALGVAIVGILGAMLAVELERARELAVLRALGQTPRQQAAMVMIQAAFMGILSGLAAIPLGLLMAKLLIEVINRRAFGWTMQTAVDPGVLWASLGLAAGAALAAGLYPAVRAARRTPAHAMRED